MTTEKEHATATAKKNAGILHFVQDDDLVGLWEMTLFVGGLRKVKRKATATATAGPSTPRFALRSG